MIEIFKEDEFSIIIQNGEKICCGACMQCPAYNPSIDCDKIIKEQIEREIYD